MSMMEQLLPDWTMGSAAGVAAPALQLSDHSEAVDIMKHPVVRCDDVACKQH